MKSNAICLPLAILIGAVVCAGVAIIGVALVTSNHQDWAFLAALAASGVVSEVRDFSPLPNSRISVSIGLIFSAGLFGGLLGVVAVGLTIAAADFAAHRKPLYKAAFNLGTLLLTGSCLVAAAEALASTGDNMDWLKLVAPVLIGSALGFLINSGLVSIAISLHGRVPLASTWSSFGWMLPHYIVLGLMALLLAAAYDRWDFGGLGLILVPLLMVWLLVKQGSDGIRAAERAASGGTRMPQCGS
jgi:hypothetical protein